MSAGIQVSVLMLAYNHAPYIRRAVESALAQQGDINFEIVIGDDRSTDGTSAIVDKLAAAHPTKIIVERPESNGGFHANFRRCLARCRGDYVAILEGDDYWVDDRKLIDQVTQLQNAPATNIAFTQGLHRKVGGAVIDWDYGSVERIVPLHELMDRRTMVAPTASLLARRAALLRLPQWLDEAPVLDIFLIVALAASGGAAYLPRATVTYRADAVGNWTSEQTTTDWDRKEQSARAFIATYTRLQQEMGFPAKHLKKRLSYFHWVIARQALKRGNVGMLFRHILQCDPGYIAGRIVR